MGVFAAVAAAVATGAAAQAVTGIGLVLICEPVLVVWDARTRVATLQAYFAVLNVIALVTLGVPGRPGALAAAGTGLAAGVLAGRVLDRRLPDALVRRLVLLLAGVGGVIVLAQAVT